MVVAEEPAHPQPDRDPMPTDRCVDQAALVVAVYPGGRVIARGTARLAGLRGGPDLHTGVGLLDLLDRNGGQVR
jgi:hypothetical protein